MSDLDPKAVASGLTPGERAVVLATEPGSTRAYREVHGIPRVALFRKGLFGPTAYRDSNRFALTLLGEQVRDIVKSEDAK